MNKKYHSFLFQRQSIVIIILFVVIIAEISILIFKDPIFLNKKAPLQKYAEKILALCSSVKYRPSCYDEEIPKLLDVISMEETFEVTKLVQEKDQNYWYCHVLGHNLSARETQKDSSQWKEVVSRCPSGMCSNGCIHGAFQERFRAEALPDAQVEELKPVLNDICKKRSDWDPTSMEQATCTHALGHLSMYITGADIRKSTTLCEEIALVGDGRDFSQLCFDGAFMQIFQPLEPEDFALIEGKQPTKKELRSFCWAFSGKKRGSCWSEGWPLFFDEIMNPTGLVRFCSKLKDSIEENRCFSGLFYVLTAQFKLDEKQVTDFCSALPLERKGQCFANAASRMIETDWRMVDRSLKLCSAAASIGVGEECYKELLLYSTYNFKLGSQEFFNLCNSLPDPWSRSCLNQHPASSR